VHFKKVQTKMIKKHPNNYSI